MYKVWRIHEDRQRLQAWTKTRRFHQAPRGNVSACIRASLEERSCGLNILANSHKPRHSGSTITGYYTVLLDSSGSTLATGFTPVTFTLDYTVPTTSYAVLVEDFNGVVFDHWVDTNTANNPRDVSMVLDPALATGKLTITAVYTDTNAIPPGDSRISVTTINLQGQQILGYYTTLWQNCQDQTQFGNCVFLDECFSPCSFLVTNGGKYQVAVADYGTEVFTHWTDNTVNRFYDLTVRGATTTISLTAVYTP